MVERFQIKGDLCYIVKPGRYLIQVKCTYRGCKFRAEFINKEGLKQESERSGEQMYMYRRLTYKVHLKVNHGIVEEELKE